MNHHIKVPDLVIFEEFKRSLLPHGRGPHIKRAVLLNMLRRTVNSNIHPIFPDNSTWRGKLVQGQ